MRIVQGIRFLACNVPEKTLVIIPTYNERENITELLGQIREIVPGAQARSSMTVPPTGPGTRSGRSAAPAMKARSN